MTAGSQQLQRIAEQSRPLIPPALAVRREARDGGYEAFDASAAALERPYTALATLLNCQPEEVAVLTSATEAWQHVVYGLAWSWQPGDRVLTGVQEYGSNATGLLQLARCVAAGGWE